MHHSRVSTAPSEAYSAGTAVLMVELLKGAISFMIAYLRIESATTYNLPANTPASRSNPLSRVRKLGREIFRSDCWKLSIPAILYGTSGSSRGEEGTLKDGFLAYQSSKTTCSMLLRKTSTLRRSKSRTKSRS